MMVLKSIPMPSDNGDKDSALFLERAEWDLAEECRGLGKESGYFPYRKGRVAMS